jgi:hypothetical protein
VSTNVMRQSRMSWLEELDRAAPFGEHEVVRQRLVVMRK